VQAVGVEVLVPKLGFAMNEGSIAEWLVADGTRVDAGQPIYSLESDKSVVEIEAPAAGTLRIIGRIGEVYAVGTVIAEIT
jgi:pyruvate/2-oxoglutarate dehydrogenase complex dihydrolipoamide acyltransferase (E2) component